jgi:hypothetical protein
MTSGNNAAAGRTANGDICAGANGNAYKHTDDGWSKWNNGSWQPMQPPQKRGAGSTAVGSNKNIAWQKDWQNRMSGSNAPAASGAGNDPMQRLDQHRSARLGGSQGSRGRFGGGGGARRFRG